MRFIRFQGPDQGVSFGWVLDGGRVGRVEGDLFREFRRMEATLSLSEVRLLPPVSPSKIICVGRNYAAHAQEHGAEVPKIPLLFLKPPSAVIGDGEPILLPPQSSQVEHEAELAVVIGKPGRWIPSEAAKDYIFGYTIANDVTARDLQRTDNQWTRAKGFDTFCPLGPWVDTDFETGDKMIACRVNGDLRQMASIHDMVFSVPQLVSFVSSIMRLEPGDLILTGTPAGVGPLRDGDEVEIEIDGLGILKNPVRGEELETGNL